MPRVENWPQLLVEHIDRYHPLPFVWGKSDCTRFMAEWLDTATGTDIAPNIPTNYKTEKGAFRVLKKHYKVKNLFELMEKLVGSPRVNPMHVQRGDIVGSKVHPDYSDVFGCALGICIGEGVAFFGPSSGGLIFYPFSREVVMIGWKV